ncbi:acetyl-CoA C-acyltransferase [bacterium]|nr:acetyl-CoA C-acyltransferase [bacterium]
MPTAKSSTPKKSTAKAGSPKKAPIPKSRPEPNGRRIAIVDGVRTPFLRAGTDFNDLMAYELGRYAVSGLLHRTALDPTLIDQVIFGNVIAEPHTANVAREVMLAADIPVKTPAYTVNEACVSAHQAICAASDQIARGYADVVIAGGTETLSDVPIRFSKVMRQKFLRANKARQATDYLKIFKDVRPKDLIPEPPAIADFFTEQSMGAACERTSRRLGITREEEDAFAVRSHQLAAKAAADGHLQEEMVMVAPPPSFKPITADNGVRGDSTMEKLAKLPPAFDRQYGTVTAANASFLTDGASAVLLMSEEAARRLGYKPRGYIRSYAFSGTDPLDEMLLGQTYATPIALARAGIEFKDIGVIEIHEAFAGQMIATIKLMGSKEFGQKLGLPGKIGDVDMDVLNNWGGSLSIGHPFGATGGRMITTCVNRLIKEDKKFGLVSACALSGLGNATIIERA